MEAHFASNASASNARPSRLLLRIPEAAEVAGVSNATMYRLIADGVVPTVLVRSVQRVRVADLEAWVASLG